MKILLAAEAENLESKIAKRFGEAPYYLIYNSETKKTEARVNPGHDDNHSALIDLVKEGILPVFERSNPPAWTGKIFGKL